MKNMIEDVQFIVGRDKHHYYCTFKNCEQQICVPVPKTLFVSASRELQARVARYVMELESVPLTEPTEP